MPSRPRAHYEVYQDNMILSMHGFPQFCADPVGNRSLQTGSGAAKIEIGDLGYFQEGRFFRLETLDLDHICQGSIQISEKLIPLGRPECTGNARKLEISAGVNAGVQGLSVGGGSIARICCTSGEGALLNLESGWAIFRHCEQATKVKLGEFMKANYRSWLVDGGHAAYLSAHDLFLVTGTYMTGNWEAATFVGNSTSFGGEVTVDAMNFANGHFSIGWRTCTPCSRGFMTGHVHLDQNMLDHNILPSFGSCCHCDEAPQNQCIFLRGWRVKEMLRFAESSLVVPISVENVTNLEWRRAQRIKRQPSSRRARLLIQALAHQGAEVAGEEDFVNLELDEVFLEEVEGALQDQQGGDIYDFVSIAKYQEDPQDVTLVHDDDVISFLKGEITKPWVGGSPDVSPEVVNSDVIPQTNESDSSRQENSSECRRLLQMIRVKDDLVFRLLNKFHHLVNFKGYRRSEISDGQYYGSEIESESTLSSSSCSKSSKWTYILPSSNSASNDLMSRVTERSSNRTGSPNKVSTQPISRRRKKPARVIAENLEDRLKGRAVQRDSLNVGVSELPSILKRGIVNVEEIDALFRIFFNKANLAVNLLDSQLHKPESMAHRSPFLFTVICTVASRFCASSPDLYPVLSSHAISAAIKSVTETQTTIDDCQAFLLMSSYHIVPRGSNEDRSWQYLGCALRLALALDLHLSVISNRHEAIGPDADKWQGREALNKARCWMLCYNADKTLSILHGKPSMLVQVPLHRRGDKMDRNDGLAPFPFNLKLDVQLFAYSSFLGEAMDYLGQIRRHPVDHSDINHGITTVQLLYEFDEWAEKATSEWLYHVNAITEVGKGNILRLKVLQLEFCNIRLAILSYRFHDAAGTKEIREGDRLLLICYNMAGRIILLLEGLSVNEESFMQYCPNHLYMFGTFAAWFLLKLTEPKYSFLLRDNQRVEIPILVRRISVSFSQIAVDDDHTPAVLSRFLQKLLGTSPSADDITYKVGSSESIPMTWKRDLSKDISVRNFLECLSIPSEPPLVRC